MKKNNIAIIQARMGSTRLPGKVLMLLEDKTVIEHVINRVKASKYINEVIVATSIQKEDLAIVSLCAKLGVRIFCGSENDVLDRYYQVSKLLKPDNIIRITADCPVIDPEVIDIVIKKHLDEDNDYTSNTLQETFPDGLDTEIMKFEVLAEAWKEAHMASQREHVTQYIIHNDKYKKGSVESKKNLNHERWTLDTKNDLELLKNVYASLYQNNPLFNMTDILGFLDSNLQYRKINNGYQRNEGLARSQLHDKAVINHEQIQ